MLQLSGEANWTSMMVRLNAEERSVSRLNRRSLRLVAKTCFFGRGAFGASEGEAYFVVESYET